jgi:hypothetical protein
MVYADRRFQALSVKKNMRGNVLQRKAEARSVTVVAAEKLRITHNIFCVYPYLSSM